MANASEISAPTVAETTATENSASSAASDTEPDASNSARDAAAGDAQVPGNPVPECGVDLGTGIPSVLGEGFFVTDTSTDWSLPEPTTGMAWDLTIERDVPVGPATVGYYWHNQFSFIPGVAGRLGFQSNGIYQADPINRPGEKETVPMVVFWLSGPPLAAELGDIAAPDARVAATPAGGLNWQTIHAKFALDECQTYRFRIGIESVNDDGTFWYGAWITNITTDEVTFLGRMLMPSDSGLLSTFSSSRTSQIMFTPTACSQLHTASAIFGAPVSDAGARASHMANYFAPPYGCRRSLIADFDGAVRHEMSVAP